MSGDADPGARRHGLPLQGDGGRGRRAWPRGGVRGARRVRSGARRRPPGRVGPARGAARRADRHAVRRGGRRRPAPVVGAAGRGRLPRRALGVRVHDQRLRGRVDARWSARGPAAARAPARGRRPVGRHGRLRPDEGRVRAGRPGRGSLRHGRAPGADLRPRRPDREVHLLARAPRRRRRGAGAGSTGRRGPDHRRPRPRDVAGRRDRGRHHRRVRRHRTRHGPRRPARAGRLGGGGDPGVDVGRPGVPHGPRGGAGRRGHRHLPRAGGGLLASWREARGLSRRAPSP
jgi:hypothetical protein